MTGCLEIERQYHKRLIFVSVGIRNLGQQAEELDTELSSSSIVRAEASIPSMFGQTSTTHLGCSHGAV